jgi:hypothetical protein
MVTILEYKYSSKSDHIKKTRTRIAEFESFKEYLNLMAVERTGMPKFYKLLSRSYDIENEEVLFTIYDVEDKNTYKIFAKVIK